MRPSFLLAACLIALFSVTASTAVDPTVSPTRAEFQYPELKAFFKEHIEQGNFDRVHMNYIPGHTPELVTFDHTGAEMFRENVEGKSVDEIRNMLVGYGFSEEDYTMKQPEL